MTIDLQKIAQEQARVHLATFADMRIAGRKARATLETINPRTKSAKDLKARKLAQYDRGGAAIDFAVTLIKSQIRWTLDELVAGDDQK
jgi:nucleoid DNA-binding protein